MALLTWLAYIVFIEHCLYVNCVCVTVCEELMMMMMM